MKQVERGVIGWRGLRAELLADVVDWDFETCTLSPLKTVFGVAEGRDKPGRPRNTKEEMPIGQSRTWIGSIQGLDWIGLGGITVTPF